MSENPFVPSGNADPGFQPTTRITRQNAPPPDYKYVISGLNIVYVATIGLFLGMMTYLVYMFTYVGASNIQDVSPWTFVAFQVVAGLLGLVLFVGFCFCCGTPKKNEKDSIHIVVALQTLTFLIGVIGIPAVILIMGAESTYDKATCAVFIFFVTQVVGAISMFFFNAFCKKLGIGSQVVTDAADRTNVWLAIALATLVVSWLTLLSFFVWPPTVDTRVRGMFLNLMTLVMVSCITTYSILNIAMVQKTSEYLKKKATKSKFKKLPRQHKKMAQQRVAAASQGDQDSVPGVTEQ